jgi:isochorismate pyruvate lyase
MKTSAGELFMREPDQCSDMSDIRNVIDSIDNQIVHLIARRGEYVKAAAKFKTSEESVSDYERVKQVIASKKRLAEEYQISPILIEKIYSVMINFFIEEEMEEWGRK